MRNKDWNDIKNYFYIPKNVEDVDKNSIALLRKIDISTPLKHNYSIKKEETFSPSLFETKI